MKTRNVWIYLFCLIGACLMQGCSVEDDEVDEINQNIGSNDGYASSSIAAQSIRALVTTKTTEDGAFYLQESEKRLLHPVNLQTSPFGNKEVRAIVIYNEVVQAGTNQTGMVDVYVKWIDEIHTRKATDLSDEQVRQSTEERKRIHGEETIEIVNDWVNSLTDGYLTLHYQTNGLGVNDIELLTGGNPEDPYEMTLWAIPASNSSTRLPADGMIAYKLSGLPPTNGEVKIATLRWYSPNGWKQAQFYYQTKN